jgi:hypothetical protein
MTLTKWHKKLGGHKKLTLFLWEDVETSLVLLGLRYRLLKLVFISHKFVYTVEIGNWLSSCGAHVL